MQSLELVLIIISSIYILFYRPINKKIKTPYTLVLLAVILIIHLLFNGYRLQMIPAYLLWLIALITSFRNPDQKSSIMIRILKIFGLVILLSLSILFPSVFPVFELPRPTGNYAVGTRDMQLTMNREEEITADETDKRTIMIKAWYPSNETGGEEDLYVDRGGRNGFARKYGGSLVTGHSGCDK